MQEYVLKIYKSATFADTPNTCFQMVYPALSNWMDFKEFAKIPLPKSPDEYMLWIENELTFVEQRNKRINDYLRMINT